MRDKQAKMTETAAQLMFTEIEEQETASEGAEGATREEKQKHTRVNILDIKVSPQA